MDIQIDKVSTEMLYKLDYQNGRFATYTTNRKCFDIASSSSHAKSNKGEVNLTRIDRSNRIISGTFWCDIPNEKCGTMKITEGRFDIKF